MTERLIESVNMVKELLQSNRQLREIIDSKSTDNEKYQNEVVVLQLENQDLKDKIDVLSRLVRPPNADDIVNLDPRRLFSDDPQLTLQVGGSEKLAQEVLELRRANRTLEDRVHHLEQNNTKITKGLSYLGNIEPTKPYFVESKEMYSAGIFLFIYIYIVSEKKKSPNRSRRAQNSAYRGNLTEKQRSGSAMLKRMNQSNSFYASDVQVTKNVWAPTTIYTINGAPNNPPTKLADMPGGSYSTTSAKNLEDQNNKIVAISKLSEILNNRMKLYH